jgi:uncharacterized protein YuzE
MRLSYDQRSGAAYLRLRDDRDNVGTISSQPFRPPGFDTPDDYFVLDFDAGRRLVGIEFLTPGERLLPSALAAAERSNRRPGAWLAPALRQPV